MKLRFSRWLGGLLNEDDVYLMQPGLHKVDIERLKLNDAEKLRTQFYAARAA